MPEIPPRDEPLTLPAGSHTLGHDEAVRDSSPSYTGRSLGGYELLEEIGRGGMGVVFKARHRALNRVVALKMILAGQLASPDDVRRFRTEAEAAALLDHPNIVPVYEVGDESGQHFFACKLIEGGGLGEHIPRLLEDAKEATRLLAQVARAVDHAHQRGILHRDLKPANILLGSQGEPHVADFGLAKRAGEVGQTQSGAIVGTPGYMAPEQARAEKEITTAADVYSMGAILYECLTGRPPFQADTALETILRVIEKEPQPPHALNPKVDPELEAVCLKCLAKDPAGRYRSAAALADDLEEWLAGGHVSARPPNTLGRLGRWVRKDFRAVAIVILVGCVVGMLFSVSEVVGLVDAATRTRDLYAASFPSETPPTLASWLALRRSGSTALDSEAAGPLVWLRLIALLLVLPSGGLLNALLFRPRTLTTALICGLGTGLVACVVALLLGFGVVQLRSPAFGSLHDDLDLLAGGFRAESILRQASRDGKESPALRAWVGDVEKRRPDLLGANLAPEERGRVLVEKIELDLWLNLHVVLWFCLSVNAAVIFIPVVCQTVLAQALGARGDRGVRFLLSYIEVAAPGSLTLVAGGLMVGGFVLNKEGAALRLLALLGWFVLSALLWDQVLRWPATSRSIIVGLWLLAGVGLAASYLSLWFAFNSASGGWLHQSRGLIVTVGFALLTGTAIYGTFVRRLRWYARFGAYLGILLAVTATWITVLN